MESSGTDTMVTSHPAAMYQYFTELLFALKK